MGGVERLRAEQCERWRKGERVPAEEYLARHGGSCDEERTLELIYQEVLLREEQGETPQASEYQHRFPQVAARVQALFEVHDLFASADSLAPGHAGGEPAAPGADDGLVPPTVPCHEGDWPPHRQPVRPPLALPRIPGYELIEELGQGGMAVVYKARQSGLDRLVAVKVLPPASSCDPAFAERFGREARVLARLSHPNIVAVHDVGQAGGLYYLVMEYVEGVNLRQALRAGTLCPPEVLSLMEQLGDALRHAHEQDVIHRDIKPENLLLDRHGRLKVADFGLAKLLGPRPGAALTGAGQVMGTWHYMAPEQIKGARDVDHRADLYSMGVTFYELLTGEVPADRIAPPSRRADVDPRLDAVVLRALEKDPARRYQSAAEIRADLETLRSPAPGLPDSGRPGRGARRQTSSYLRWVVLPAVVLLLLLLVGSCAGMARDPEGSGLLLSFNGFLVWVLVVFVASLVWLLRQRDEGTVVPICGVLSLLVALVGLVFAGEAFLARPGGGSLSEAGPGVLFAVWGVASTVFHILSCVSWFVGGVGLLLWRGWARRLVVATCWLGLGYYAMQVPVYATFLMAKDVEEFSREAGPDEGARFLTGAALVLVLALVFVVRVACTLGQLVVLRRPEVVRAFDAVPSASD